MAELIAILSGATLYHWLIAGVLMLILELMAGTGFYVAICGVAALLVALLMVFIPLTWEPQWLIFSLLSVVTCLVWHRLQKNQDQSNEVATQINQRMARYVGRQGHILLVNGEAKLKMDDTVWLTRARDETSLEDGLRVTVVSYEGTVLIVEPHPDERQA